MTKRRRKGSQKRKPAVAAPQTDKPQVCQFPPAYLSDFVIHFRNTAFHVHKLALIHHSSYFRTYIEQLTAGERATDECDEHTDIPHCIVLPDACGEIDADVDDFKLFLCHLYFAQQYSCIPYKAAVDVSLDAEPAPALSLSCPTLSSLAALKAASSSEFDSASPPAVHETVLSLCRHFDCSLVLSRAEDNVLLAMSETLEPSFSDVEWRTVRSCFLLALQFDLQRVKEECVPLLALHCVIGSSRKKEWRALRARLDADTLFELMLAAFDTDGEVHDSD